MNIMRMRARMIEQNNLLHTHKHKKKKNYASKDFSFLITRKQFSKSQHIIGTRCSKTRATLDAWEPRCRHCYNIGALLFRATKALATPVVQANEPGPVPQGNYQQLNFTDHEYGAWVMSTSHLRAFTVTYESRTGHIFTVQRVNRAILDDGRLRIWIFQIVKFAIWSKKIVKSFYYSKTKFYLRRRNFFLNFRRNGASIQEIYKRKRKS